MRDLLKALAGCKNVAILSSTIREVFSEFGEIAHMDILTMKRAGNRQALCLLRLQSAEQERQLMTHPGVSRFGSDLALVVDLPGEQASRQKPGQMMGEVARRGRDAPHEDAFT